MELLESRAPSRQGVDVRRTHPRVARASQKIGAVLVGDEQQEVGARGHGGGEPGAGDARQVGRPGQSALILSSRASVP
jgi:hypothetical protein